jgi:molybdate transport system substrate-binding protein
MSEDPAGIAEAAVRILSAGAPKTGVSRCAEAFTRETGHQVSVSFATAPVLRGKVEAGEAAADVVIAPLPALADFAASGLTVAGINATVGSVKAGVAVRAGAPAPDLSSVEAFTAALKAAQSLVYNEASSGQYIAQLMDRLGLTQELAAKTLRLPTGAAVMRHLAGSAVEREIGFGQLTEIRLHLDLGLELVGPLPEAIGKTTTYGAGLLAAAKSREPAKALIAFMASPEGRRIFVETGVE